MLQHPMTTETVFKFSAVSSSRWHLSARENPYTLGHPVSFIRSDGASAY